MVSARVKGSPQYQMVIPLPQLRIPEIHPRPVSSPKYHKQPPAWIKVLSSKRITCMYRSRNGNLKHTKIYHQRYTSYAQSLLYLTPLRKLNLSKNQKYSWKNIQQDSTLHQRCVSQNNGQYRKRVIKSESTTSNNTVPFNLLVST